jgi:hypothetical protein
MKKALLAIAASLGLAVGALSATSTAADARVSVHIGIYGGNYYQYQPCCYYPRYRVYPYAVPRHLVCYTALVKKVYWRHHRKHKVWVPVRVCSYRYR